MQKLLRQASKETKRKTLVADGTEIPTIENKTTVEDKHSLEVEIAAFAAVRHTCRDIKARIVMAVETESPSTITGGLTSLVGILEFFRVETTVKDRVISECV